MIPRLYRPTDDEITAVIARGLTKHRGNREITSRIDRAAAILRDWTLYAEVYPHATHLCWRVPSATKPNERHYLIPAAERGSYCTCPDYERGDHQHSTGSVPGDRAPIIGSQPGAPHIGSQIWCKHRMAVTAYVRILADRLLALIDDGTLDLCALAGPPTARHIILADGAPICDIEPPALGRVAFAWHYDAVSFATWLAGQPLPQPDASASDLPGPADWPPAGHLEWQPELSPEQMRRWYATGLTV